MIYRTYFIGSLRNSTVLLFLLQVLLGSIISCKTKTAPELFARNNEIIASLKRIGDTTTNDFTKATTKYLISKDFHLPDSIDTQRFILNFLDLLDKRDKMIWKNDFGPAEFCEFVLPPMHSSDWDSNWRSSVEELIADSLDLNLSMYSLSSRMNELLTHILQKQNIQLALKGVKQGLSFNQLITSNQLDCNGLTRLGVYFFRGANLPCALDFTPHWGNYQNRHYWGTVVRPNNDKLTFNVDPRKVPEFNFDWSHNRRYSKVYRQIFTVNDNSHRIKFGYMPDMPSLFNTSCIKDVSSEYDKTSSVEVTLSQRIDDEKPVYLSVFDNKKWVLVGWSDAIQENSALFNAVFDSVVYLPQTRINNVVTPSESPFFMYKGVKHIFIPDHTSTRSIVLKRKFCLEDRRQEILDKSKGGLFQGSNNKQFDTTEELLVIEESLEAHGYEFDLEKNKKARYVRYLSPDSAYCNIAEMSFFDEFGNKLSGEIISNAKNESSKNAFDGNPLSYYESSDPSDSWIGLDLGKARSIDKIKMYPRSDLNGIEIGDLYELFFWDGKWISLGKKTAKKHDLTYHDVPNNALLLLRNLSSGSEERIFSYVNNKQYFF